MPLTCSQRARKNTETELFHRRGVKDVLCMPIETIYRGHSDKVFAVAWSPGGRYIASGSRDTTVHVWDAVSGTRASIYRGHTNCLLSVAWSPAGKQLASGCTDGVVQVWHAFTGDNIITYRGHSRFVRSV